ncbi:Proliferating cell nuclear antigen like [Actinidia chinensis var. chinensis]|uniref:Proliferating cell nuclear antigen like n=1 Tax=Actinidia chinensis var. chinensis TaxID=1590841 RepID=A0A2R6Q8W7_ACTCC|nr:Proliferating cell nuclear antigen like [Actinidia chinensis var. chinensis]
MIFLKKYEGKLLRGLLSPLTQIDTHGAAIWRHDYFTVKASFMSLVGAVRLKSSYFDWYTCTETTRTWVDIQGLDYGFNAIADDESLTITALTMTPDQDTFIFFMVVPHGTDEHTLKALRGRPIPHLYRDFNESEFEYEVLVAIRSEMFRLIINHFAAAEAAFVDVSVTHDEVTFTADPNCDDIMLTTEIGACVIAGTYDFHRITIRIYLLRCEDAFMEALDHCKTVWLLQSGGDSPDMVNFPVGDLGYFMFYMDD